ncbi:MAG: hypothetical protein C4583_06795 [Anaerolineaceae bacterium]|nr:MAG: hypothetical protein C4583_06795 [Anaerolineaceae bacterium]
MNAILSYLIEVLVTLSVCALIVAYLRPFLKKVLIDLCGTEDRAQFWTAFSNILLIGLPMILAIAYRPEAMKPEEFFFSITGKLSGNLGGMLFALVGVGMVVSFFALVAPRPAKEEKK